MAATSSTPPGQPGGRADPITRHARRDASPGAAATARRRSQPAVLCRAYLVALASYQQAHGMDVIFLVPPA